MMTPKVLNPHSALNRGFERMYETKYTTLRDLRAVAKYMRTHRCEVLTTSVSVIAFVRHGGKILVTVNAVREIVGVVAFVTVEAPETFDWDKHVLIQAMVMNDSKCHDTTDSIRLALHAVLSISAAKYAVTAAMKGGSECEAMMLSCGFLPEDLGNNARLYVCRNTDVHTGAVILERILCGTCETLVEV